jgi:voltage-gated potassium channel Kch
MSTQKNHDRYHMITAVVAILTLLCIGTFTFHFVEGWNLATSFYFSVATLTTVGYGDIHPTTDLSRIIVSIYLLVGVGVMLTSLTVIATDRINKTAGRFRGKSDSK